MRNALSHGYFKVETIAWKTLENDLPTLQAQTETLLQANNDPGKN